MIEIEIITKLDELMRLCDQLEAILTAADETRHRLLESLHAEALAPEANWRRRNDGLLLEMLKGSESPWRRRLR